MKQLSFGALGSCTPRSEEPAEWKGQAAGRLGRQGLCGTFTGTQAVQLVLRLGGIFVLPRTVGFQLGYPPNGNVYQRLAF